MLEIKQRSKGYVDKRYFEEKAKLMKARVIGECIICHKDMHTKAKNRLYCSDECFQNWFKQFHPPFLWNRVRAKVFRRDHYTCRKCGRKRKKKNQWGDYDINLIADHIVPISLGGEEWDLSNIQTLCEACNRIKTKEDMGKIAELRKLVKQSDKSEPLTKFTEKKLNEFGK
jgi:5-methylcytosine-specific restriction endonuclease McrA